MCGVLKILIGVVVVAVIGYGAYSFAPWHSWFGLPVPVPTPIEYIPAHPDEPPSLPPKKRNKKFGKPSRPVKVEKPKPGKPAIKTKRPGKGLSSVYTCDDVRRYAEMYGWELMKLVAVQRGYSPRQIARAEACL